MKVAVVLALALLAVQNAEAGGKGFILGKGKGKGDVNVDVQCNQVCNDVCVPVPNKVCNEVPYQTQVCNKVPVQKTKQVCSKVCTQTYTQQVSTGKGAVVIPMSKGKGWGRHLLTKHGVIKAGFLGGKGKGGALVDTQCNDVCNDVQYTAYDTQCQQVTKTRTQCDVVYNQQCNKVCKPVCNKVTTVTTTQVVSGGKGVAVNIPISFSKGKGH